MKILIVVLIAVTTCLSASASKSDLQTRFSNEYRWGEKEDEAKGNWMFLNSAIDEKDYKSALKPLYWLLSNTHDLNVALYVQGAKVLEHNVKAEKEPNRKQVLQDSTLWLYDERIRLYGEEAKVLNRKGRIAWKYLHKRKGSEKELYELYQSIYEKNQDAMLIQNATYYYRTAITQYRKQILTKSVILSKYSEMNSFLDRKEKVNASDGKKLATILKNRERIEKEFDKYVDLTCDEIQSFYSPGYNESPSLQEAKKINLLLLKKKCISNDLFMSTNEKILLAEPSSSRYAVTAKMYLNQDKSEVSYTYFTKAIELEKDDRVKAGWYLELAQIDRSSNQLVKSRSNARLALNLDPSRIEAYELIGDLYLLSIDKCSSDDVLRNKSIYIAAYEKYKLAGNNAKMNLSRQQFPSIEEIFVRNKKEGDLVHTGCWINEEVKLKKR